MPNDEMMLAAAIAARLGQRAEARQMIDPVLKFHRELYTRGGNDDLGQHLQLARRTVCLRPRSARTASDPGQLKEAAGIIDGFRPPCGS